MEEEQFALMVHVVHQTEAAIRHYGKDIGLKKAVEQLSEQFGNEKVIAVLGSGIKKLAPAEKANYGRTNRSLHVMYDLNAGHVLKKGDIEILRTEKILTPGMSPEFYDLVIGKTLARNVKSGQGLNWDDLLK